ncbi:hypothetical protein BJ912DRAFT_1042829 [Pholiota molesta]|nr:hypothetical protein BJ912DRAFT_1042829 [Pholiota molesta]
MSRYAPWRRPYTEWSTAECVAFLADRARVPVMIRNPRSEVFLPKAYTKGIAGSRTGREWSRKDWEAAMENLEEISRAWNDVSIRESLQRQGYGVWFGYGVLWTYGLWSAIPPPPPSRWIDFTMGYKGLWNARGMA